MVNNTTLYIIGNGFDLHHGIQSTYSHYASYLEENNKSLLETIETYLASDELWSDFETSFAELDTDAILDYASAYLVSYGTDDWSDSYHHDYQYEIEQIVKSLSSLVQESFLDWIKQVDIPNKAQVADKILSLDENATYLNFNYTNTLEKVYDIPKSQIIYIHGVREASNIVLGHGWSPVKNPSGQEYDPKTTDTRVLEGQELINQYFSDTYKPTKKIIKENEGFFKKLKHLEKIYVFGHSLSPIDIRYYETICNHIDRDEVEWVISYWDDQKLFEYQNRMTQLGINLSKVTFIKLDTFIVGVK